MGVLPFPFSFRVIEKRHVQYPLAYERIIVQYRKRYPLLYKTASFNKKYHFYFRTQGLIARLDDELEAARIVVRPTHIERPWYIQREVTAVDTYIHRELIAQQKRRAWHLQHDAPMYGKPPAHLIDVSRVMHASGYQTTPIIISAAQAASMLKTVESRFTHAPFASSYRALKTVLARHNMVTREDTQQLAVDTNKRASDRLVYKLETPEKQQDAMRIIERAAYVELDQHAHRYDEHTVVLDAPQLATRQHEVTITQETESAATRLVSNVISPDTEILSVKGVVETQKDEARYATVEPLHSTVVDSDEFATGVKLHQTVVTQDDWATRTYVQQNVNDTILTSERRAIERMDIEQITEAERKPLRTLEVAIQDHALRDAPRVMQVEQTKQAARHIEEETVIERERAAKRIYRVDVEIEQPEAAVREVERCTHIDRAQWSKCESLQQLVKEVALYGERDVTTLLERNDETYSVSIDVLEAEIDESINAALYDVLEVFVDEATTASSFEVFITDVVEQLDAKSVDALLTEVDEDLTAGTPEEEKKKKLIWIIMGRPSWIMQWNQWKKTR